MIILKHDDRPDDLLPETQRERILADRLNLAVNLLAESQKELMAARQVCYSCLSFLEHGQRHRDFEAIKTTLDKWKDIYPLTFMAEEEKKSDG